MTRGIASAMAGHPLMQSAADGQGMPTFPQSDVDPAGHSIAMFAQAAAQLTSARETHRFVFGASALTAASLAVFELLLSHAEASMVARNPTR